MNAVEKCREALKSKSPITLYQAIALTKLDGWDASKALAELVVLGEAVRSNDDGATLWSLKNRVGVNQTEPVVGQQSAPATITGRA
jgi:hypothetical protein